MRLMLLAIVLFLLASPAFAQIAVSVNDNKVMLDNGTVKVVPNAPPDTLSVIDLKASPPKVSAQLQAGKGAAGVSINRAGTLALVANRSEGTVSVFSIAGNTLTPVGKVNLALDTLPKFKSATGYESAALGGIIHIGPTIEYMERASDDAKYRRYSKQPFLEITIPSISDPSLAPAGKHVMSVWMQSAPYHLGDSDWNLERKALGDVVVNLLEDYAPGFRNSILHSQVLTPLDLQQTYGLSQGHLYHAEMALDQIFFMRPVPGWSRYHTPIENLYLCGSGTHPGGGITGLPGYFTSKEILKSRSRRR